MVWRLSDSGRRGGSFRRLVGAGLATAAVAASATVLATPASAAVTSCSATSTSVYVPPAAVTAAPGTLLACAPSTLPQIGGANAFKGWQVQYASTDAHGAKIAVSGAIIVPTAAWTGTGTRPVVAFTPGTLGAANKCAFSRQLGGQPQDQYQSDNIAALINAGFGVAITDGVGYLNGQIHQYIVGASGGHAILDAARTASQVPGSGLSAGTKVGLWGYSEGGSNSLWGAQLAASYAPELNIVGDASGGVPGNLKQVATQLNGGPFAGFLVDAVVGLSNAYPNLPFTSLLNDAGRQAIVTANSNCLDLTLASFLFADIKNYTTQGLSLDQIYALKGTDGTTWGQVLDQQQLGVNVGLPGSGKAYTIKFPVYQYRGIAEEIVSPDAEDAVYKAYCGANIPTKWAYILGDHLLADGAARSSVVSWFGDRFAGKANENSCL